MLKIFLVIILTTFPCFGLIIEGDASGRCYEGYNLIAGKCFKFYQKTTSVSEATKICKQDGGHLASVKTTDEYSDLLNHINKKYGGQYWISGSLTNGKWMWEDGQLMNRAWFGRTPATSGNRCSYFCSFTNKYWDNKCTLKKRFICEKEQEIYQAPDKLIIENVESIPESENVCKNGYHLIAGKCFKFYQETVSVPEATMICKEDGGHLASVKTTDEYSDLLSHINKKYGGRYWISGSLTNGKWMWEDGTLMNSAWFGRTPATSGNLCSYFCSFTNKYWDAECTLKKKFICEKEQKSYEVPGELTLKDLGNVKEVTEICADGYHLIAGKCFKFYQETVSVPEATTICKQDGGHLASVKTTDEYSDLLSHINKKYGGRYWISGSLTNGKWMWEDGTLMNSAWFGRTPATSGNLCSYFCSFTNKYWDAECTLKKRFICEMEQSPYEVPGELNYPSNTVLNDLEIDEEAKESCTEGFNLIDGKCFKFYQETVTVHEATMTCKEDGGHLASVKTTDEYSDLLSHINKKYGGQYWISGSLTNGKWVWEDGTLMNSAWFGRKPATSGNLCSYFCSFTNKYWDAECTLRKRFICEKEQEVYESSDEATFDSEETFSDENDPCTDGYHFIAEKCFQFNQERTSVLKATQTCAQDGAQLASLKTEEEYNGLLAFMNKNYRGRYWISGHLRNEEWLWQDGDLVNTNWFDKTPKKSGMLCSLLCSYTEKYWARKCHLKNKFICEKKPFNNNEEDYLLVGDNEVMIT